MRLTLINQFFTPDLAPTGHMAASLAGHRATLGDQVTVITSTGGYVSESDSEGVPINANLNILRLWTPRLGKTRQVERVIDYVFFYLLAALRMLLLPRQDLIVSLTTPPFIAWTAVLHKLLHPSTSIVLWNMDCYPEIAERMGVIAAGGFLSRLLRSLNHILFKRLDHIVCLDSAMRALLEAHYDLGKSGPSLHIIPNWELLAQFPPDLQPPVWEDAPAFDADDRFVVLYLGNAGFGHRFETVIEAAEKLKDEAFVFLFVGGGQQWPWLADAVRGKDLENVILHPYVPKATTPSVLAFADCALITLREQALGLISPSKLHANLAMELPVLYIGPEDSNVDEAIKRYDVGHSVRHGDVAQAMAFLRSLRNEPAALARYRANARLAFEAAYSDAQTLPLFDALISSATNSPR
jgi:glycosyltransferase involved in cell wall biosynthesis